MPYHPHPHIIICTSFISSIDYNVFIVLQCHLKDHLCRKSDAKQWFTTTTTCWWFSTAVVLYGCLVQIGRRSSSWRTVGYCLWQELPVKDDGKYNLYKNFWGHVYWPMLHCVYLFYKQLNVPYVLIYHLIHHQLRKKLNEWMWRKRNWLAVMMITMEHPN